MTTLDSQMVDRPGCPAGKDGGVTPELQRRLQAITARYRELASELAEVRVIASRSLARRLHRCGKPNSACTKDPPPLHGPYWHLTAKVAGKTVKRRLSEDEAANYQEWIASDRRLRAIAAELRKVGQDIIELTSGAQRQASKV